MMIHGGVHNLHYLAVRLRLNDYIRIASFLQASQLQARPWHCCDPQKVSAQLDRAVTTPCPQRHRSWANSVLPSHPGRHGQRVSRGGGRRDASPAAAVPPAARRQRLRQVGVAAKGMRRRVLTKTLRLGKEKESEKDKGKKGSGSGTPANHREAMPPLGERRRRGLP